MEVASQGVVARPPTTVQTDHISLEDLLSELENNPNSKLVNRLGIDAYGKLFSIARGYEEAQQFQEAERVYRCLVKLKGPNERAAAIRLDFIHDTKAALSQETLEAFTQLSVQKYSPMTKSGIKQAATEEIARGIYTGC